MNLASDALCVLLVAASPMHAEPVAWAPGGTPVATALNLRFEPVMCSTANGGSMTVWLQDFVILAQSLAGSGSPDSGWTSVDGLKVAPDAPAAPYWEGSPRIAGDGEGGAFVVWHDQRDYGCIHSCWGEYMELYASHITRDGSTVAGWSSAGMKIGSAMNTMREWAGNLTAAREDFNTVVAADGTGGVLVAWQERWYPALSGAISGIHAQRLSADGHLLWEPRGVLVAHAAGLQEFPVLAPTGDGGTAIVWEDSRDDTTAFRIYGQRLSPEGTPLWDANGRRLTHGFVRNEEWPVVAGVDHGELAVGWQAGTASDSIVMLAQRVDADGHPLWPGDVALSGGPHTQSTLSATQDALGDDWFAWVASSSAGTTEVDAQRLNRYGAPACGWRFEGNPVCSATSSVRSYPRLVAGGTGDAYVVWLDGGLPHASRLTASGALAASWTDGGLALSNSEYGSDQLAVTSDGEQGALVTWEEGVMPDGWYESVQVQRLSRAGIWDGVVATEDALPDSCVAPRQPVVEGFRPNPTHVSTATVMFSLPQDGTVRIELFDLSGRRVGEQDAGFLVAGRHTIPLHVGHSTPPGVYFVRMTQAGRSAMARGVVLP